jgi:RNA polymerase sigma-70 factor, ECF subfamily
MNQLTVTNLIHRSRENDLEAFRALVEGHQSFVFSVAFRLLCNEDNAKDVAQETFIRVWKHLFSFKEEMKFTTWLYKIATNLCYDQLKSENRRNHHEVCAIEDSALFNIASDENLEKTLINSELAKTIRFLTNQLTPKQKLVFTLRELEGLEIDEIKVITGLSPEKIKSNLYCARQNIREKLEKIQ